MQEVAPVRIGIVGLGIMGELYAKTYKQHPLATVVAVSSRRAERVKEFAERFQARGYTNYRELIEQPDIDAIVIATPDDQHFAPAHFALSAGKHILVEKPFTTSTSEADRLIQMAAGSRLKIQVAFNHRWLPSYHHAKQIIDEGKIGTPLSGFARKNDPISVPTEMISWAGQTTPAWFLSSHDIDLVRWLFSSEPVEARAWGRREVLCARGIPTYDTIQSQVRFVNGAIATFESGWIYPNTFPTIVDSFVEVIGTQGHVHLDRKHESIEISTPNAFSYPRNSITSSIFGRLRGALPACADDFIDSILNDTEPHVSGFDGRQVTATLEAIHASLLSDATVAVAPFSKQ